MSRLPVRKTYKLYIGGAFPRSESGRTFDGWTAFSQRRPGVAQGRPRGGARRAQRSGGVVRATAYNRGQVLYRLAEMMESRASALAAVCGGPDEVERCPVDRVV